LNLWCFFLIGLMLVSQKEIIWLIKIRA
jgi:hypothetical protein